jgi:hypothetical protein
MSDDKSISIVNIGKLSKPANTLIEKVSAAFGGIFEPWQIERVAKAESEAALIRAETEIKVKDLHRRAMHRFVEEEAIRQKNMESITQKALPQLQEQSDPSKMQDDWVANFFDKSRIVSDSEMQELWAKVLAGEANLPGSYSKRTVNFLSELDRRDAELFLALCRFGWSVGDFTPLIFDAKADIYLKHGINFGALTHLDSIGLLQYNNLTGFVRTGLPDVFAVAYYGKPLVMSMENQKEKNLAIGHVLLTSVGRELATVCMAQGIPDFYDYVKDRWKTHLPQPKTTEQGAAPNGGPTAPTEKSNASSGPPSVG